MLSINYFPYYRLVPARFLELKDQVQKETNVDYFAGSASYESMFAIIDNYLTENWDSSKGRILLARIARILGQSEALQSYLKDPRKYSENDIEGKFPISFGCSGDLIDVAAFALNFEIYVS